MKAEIKIPSSGESITEVTIASIIKPSGSFVQQDEEILEMETDKVNQMLYAPATGQLNLTVKEHDIVKVGAVIGTVDTDAKGEEAPPKEEAKKETPPAPSPPLEKKPEEPEKADGARKSEEDYVKEITEGAKEEPAATKEEPPEQAASKAPPPSGDREERRERMSKLRKIVSQKLVEVKNTTALLTTFNEVDMSTVIKVRNSEKENFQKKHGVKLGFMSFFVKAVISALEKFPSINAFIDKDEIVYRNYCDIGIAVGTEKGLMVPVLRNAEKMSYAEIEKQIKDFAEKARKGTISVDDIQGGTFTISNGGVYGSLLSTPILNPPQSGILGMHAIVERPIAVNGKVEIRPMMYLALSYDHRIVDGKESIEFLVHIKKNLEDPARYLLDL